MGFGERKAYFLSLRPNMKYATWFGQIRPKKEKGASVVDKAKGITNKKAK